MDPRSPRLYRSFLLLAASPVISLLCTAQATSAGSRPPGPSRVDVFGTYDYFHPFNSEMLNQEYVPITGGVAGGVTDYLSRSFGIQGEYTYFFNHPDYCASTVQGGPVLRHQFGRLVPFMHAMGGVARVGPTYAHSGAASPCSWGWVATGGIGLDYILPSAALGNHVALRLVEGDFHYSDVKYGAQTAPVAEPASEGQITAYRLSAGLVFRFGDMSPSHPASFGCEVEPVQVFPGDPITVTGRVINLEENRKQLPVYTWSSNGGHITGGAGGATIATSGMAAGDYVVTGRVSEGSGPTQHADCTASFRVVAFEPPTIACTANPSTILSGGVSTITAVARSPQNRALNYSYGATAGQITGTGTTATLAAADVRPGTINVTCNVVDDRGNSASSSDCRRRGRSATTAATSRARLAQTVQYLVRPRSQAPGPCRQ